MSYPTSPVRTRRQAGFTLIEAMIAVAIIGILAAVAYPSYRDHLLRGHLADGTNALAAFRANMERHFQDNRTYATVTSGGTTYTTPCAAGTDAQRTVGRFLISCDGTPTAGAFSVQAVGNGPVSGFTYKIDQSGVTSTTAAPSGYGTCATQWITKKGQSCS